MSDVEVGRRESRQLAAMWHLETQTWRGSQEGSITFGKERRSLDERRL